MVILPRARHCYIDHATCLRGGQFGLWIWWLVNPQTPGITCFNCTMVVLPVLVTLTPFVCTRRCTHPHTHTQYIASIYCVSYINIHICTYAKPEGSNVSEEWWNIWFLTTTDYRTYSNDFMWVMFRCSNHVKHNRWLINLDSSEWGAGFLNTG